MNMYLMGKKIVSVVAGYLAIYSFLQGLVAVFAGYNFLTDRIFGSFPFSGVAAISLVSTFFSVVALCFARKDYAVGRYGKSALDALIAIFITVFITAIIAAIALSGSETGDMRGLGTVIYWGFLAVCGLIALVSSLVYIAIHYLFCRPADVSIEMKIQRGAESWMFIYVCFGVLATIVAALVSVLPVSSFYRVVLIIISACLIGWLCFRSAWFQNKLIGWKNKNEQAWRKI